MEGARAYGLLRRLRPLWRPAGRRPAARREIYECGVDTIGSAWIRFDIAYYLFALIFVAFEVDVLYILPVAVVFDRGDYMWRDLIELALFVGILLLAIVYAWRKGVLHWRQL